MNTLQSHNPNKDIEIVNPPTDSISSLTFGPNPNQCYLVSTSWDNKASDRYLYGKMLASRQYHRSEQTHGRSNPPTTTLVCGMDGNKIFSGGCDKGIMQWDLANNAFTQVAMHDAPIKKCHFIEQANLLMTAGWDKKLRYWDLRAQTPVLEVLQPERIYDADVTYPIAVTALADRKIMVYDLRNPGKEYQQNTSPLKFQSRCIKTFRSKNSNEGEGYALGSIEGRVAVRYPSYPEEGKDLPHFSFKCHRETQTAGVRQVNPMKIYSVNSIAFHPVYGGTFATAGSDGVFNFWDKDSKQRLKALGPCKWSNGEPAPITAASFSPNGTIYAYALSYDWSRGHEYYDRNIMKPTILLHGECMTELKPKPSTG
eukprot:Ihof_evm6s68 gene=Ihof_evmTU6s68